MVAKCGLYLKQKGKTNPRTWGPEPGAVGFVCSCLTTLTIAMSCPAAVTVEGVFRISGSNRRMKELQDIFDKPPTYGRDVVWGPWSVHDAANVLRRYLNQMPVGLNVLDCLPCASHAVAYADPTVLRRNLWYQRSCMTSSGMHCVSYPASLHQSGHS